MSKRNFLILVLVVFVVTVSATIFAACESKTQSDGKDGNDVFGDCDELAHYITDCKTNEPGEDRYNTVESELPPESFVGTVVEEDTYYMVVEPNVDEEEYEISKRIRVEYLHDHIDYLYGIGRKVVITYIPPMAGGTTITTDDIRHDGFEEFELSVQYRQDSIPARFAEIQYAGILTLVANNRDFDEYASDYNLYYYGLHDVYVTVDGNTLPLKEALNYGKVTIDGIVADCNRRAAIGEIEEYRYKDGGSVVFDFGDYKIIKYHTLEGNRDVYIGDSNMDINAKNSTAVCIGAYLWKDWGLRLEARDVTNKGATIVFKQKGGNITGDLDTGEAFYLEKKDGNKWVPVDTKPLLDYAFNMIAYMLNKDGETELETNWEWLYGELRAGQYRISKEVMDFRKTADFDEQIYYAYFEIPEQDICSYPPYSSNNEGTTLKCFDYESLNINYDAPGVISDGFKNTERTEISDLSDVVTLAKNECTVEYDTVSYAVDIGNTETFTIDELCSKAEMYEINFSKSTQAGGDQTVYIDKNGVTQLIVYGE
ncbi:MAG: hypothetical protein J6E38_03455 [Clostridia bacterium]|nr:hypothetical protein [Clostridia bacterium]